MRCIDRLSKTLTERCPRETVLIVRSEDEGRRLLTECARAGALLLGVRAVTPPGLAKEICAEELAGKHALQLMREGEKQDLLFQSLLQMPETGFFAKPHVRERKTAEMLLESILELERELAPPLHGNERLEAVQLLREHWRSAKGDTLLDETDLLHMAIRCAQDKLQVNDMRYVVLSTELFPALDRKLIETVAKDALTVFPVEIPDLARTPARLMGAEASELRTGLDRERLHFWRCRGAETEQQAIMRDILTERAKVDDCAVIYLSAADVPGLYAAAKTFHLPIFVSGGIPLTESTAYDVLKLAETWALSHYNAEELRELVLSGALGINAGKLFCRALRSKNIGWGKDRYALLYEQDENGFPDPETAENWKTILDLLFQASERAGSIEEQRRVLSGLLDQAVGIRGEQDALARTKAQELLSRITWLDENETVLGRLLELLEQARYSGGEKAEGSILAVPLSEAFCTGRKRLYFCGLNRFSMQNGDAESPILPDEDRLCFGLAGKQEMEQLRTFRLLLTLHQHEGQSILSYHDYDLERMIPLSPAPVFQSLADGQEVKSISCIPGEALTAGDYVSRGRKILVRTEDTNTGEQTEQEPPFALHEEESYAERLDAMAFSATTLEMALKCPFQFYLHKLVGLDPPTLPVRRNDSWLDAKEMGILCHAVLERYYRDPSISWESILAEEIEKWKSIRPEGPASAVNADTSRAKEMIRRAVDWTGQNGRVVLSTEKAFGKNAKEDPVPIRIGDRDVLLSGSIDRIDRLPDGALAILDYKTGGGKAYRDHLALKLQQYLYTLAFEQLEPGQKVGEGAYLFLRDSADPLQIPQTEAERERKKNTILSLLEWLRDEERALIAAPAFDIRADGSFESVGSEKARQKQYKDCGLYCEFKDLCPILAQNLKSGQIETPHGEVSADA